jgi:flavin reductase (DIM6/NTAB) family NADH-FMN oxidoreductase RutF
VNVLNSDQADVARRFTGLGGEVGEQRYAGARWEELGTGSSALLGAAVSLDCYVDEIVSKNTHSIVIGSVAEIVTADVLPLLYFEGEYSPMINRKIGKLL